MYYGCMGYLFAIILFCYIAIFIYKTKTGSPSVMSKQKDVKTILKYVREGMKVADMGCGNAEVLIEMVQQGAKSAEGWEIEPLVYWQARANIWKRGMSGKVKVNFASMWGADLSKYDLIYVYQLTRYAAKFVKKIKKEMKKGAIVVANTYPLDGLELKKKMARS